METPLAPPIVRATARKMAVHADAPPRAPKRRKVVTKSGHFASLRSESQYHLSSQRHRAVVDVILRSGKWTAPAGEGSGDESDEAPNAVCAADSSVPEVSQQTTLRSPAEKVPEHIPAPCKFSEIKVNTKTFIAVLNCSLHLENLYHALEITPYVYKCKKVRKETPGRKEGGKTKEGKDGKKASSETELQHNTHLESTPGPLQPGSVISVKLENGKSVMSKGAFKKQSARTFRNSVAVDIFISDTKKLNIKISSNGNIQLTGCKSAADCVTCVRYIVRYIQKSPDIYTLDDPSRGSEIDIHVSSVMRNINYNIGFAIDRQKLTNLIRHRTCFAQKYMVLYAPQFFYAGVNVKQNFPHSTRHVKRYVISSWSDTGLPTFSPSGSVPVDDFVKMQCETKGKKSSKKFLENVQLTWLIFESGKIIFSGPNSKVMRQPYNEFNALLRDHWDIVRENISVKSATNAV